MEPGRAVSVDICREIVGRVFAWQHKPSNYRTFARDLLVVVCGLRPVVFCDEVVFRSGSWTHVAEFLKGVEALSGVALSGMVYRDPCEWDVKGGDVGVLYLVDRDRLREKCSAGRGGMRPVYLWHKPSSPDVHVVDDGLPVTDLVISLAKSTLATLESGPSNGGVADFGRIPGVSQCLPMLNGWLLEYPLIYAYGIEHLKPKLGRVVASMDEKTVVRCCLECKLVRLRQHRMAKIAVPQLYSFTIPADVLHDHEVREVIATMKDRLKRRVAGMEGVWGKLEVVREDSGRVAWAV